jgi:hypothetical protein
MGAFPLSHTIPEIATDDYLASVATRSDRRLGKEILEAGGMDITSAAPQRVTALVTPAGGQKRTVELTADTSGLHCRCT